MASEVFKNIFIGLVLTTLFSFLIINFTIGLADNYGINDVELTEGAIGSSEYTTYLTAFQNDSDDLRESFGGGTENVDDVVGIFGILTNFIKMMFTPFNLVAQVAENVLHIPSTFTSVLLGILIFVIILGVWSILRRGD